VRLAASLSVLDYSAVGSAMSLRSFLRLGASISVLDCSHLGASFSLRGFARLGSSLSVLDMFAVGSAMSLRSFSRLGSALSVLDYGHLGSSLALRAFARFGSSLSVLDYTCVGSSLSLRSYARLGSSLSILDYSHFASSLSLRSFARFGSSLSVLDFGYLGSSLSLRSFARLGSSMSLLDFAALGSSMSVRNFMRCGTYLSVYDTGIVTDLVVEGRGTYQYMSGGFMGSSEASVGDLFAQLAEVHGSLLALGGAVFGSELGTEVVFDGLSGQHKMQFDGTELQWLVPTNVRRMRMGETSGSLHGTWYADSPFEIRGTSPTYTFQKVDDSGSTGDSGSIAYGDSGFEFRDAGTSFMSASTASMVLNSSTVRFNGDVSFHGQVVADLLTQSDRHLKKDIRSLREEVRKHQVGQPVEDPASVKGNPSWILRQLRPVSYRFKNNEAKGMAAGDSNKMRYGFIADELQEIIPSVVRTVTKGEADPIKAVMYQDLIALTIAAQQTQESKLRLQEERTQEHSAEFDAKLNKTSAELNKLDAKLDTELSKQSTKLEKQDDLLSKIDARLAVLDARLDHLAELIARIAN